MSSGKRITWALLVLVVMLAAFVAGWWIGSAEAVCRGQQNCFLDVPLFEAIGTWVAGIGTIAALVFAGLQLAGDQQERAREAVRVEQAQRARFQSAFSAAQRVEIGVSASTWFGDYCREVHLTVTNQAHADDIYDLSGGFEHGQLEKKRKLAPGETHSRRRMWDGQSGPHVTDRQAWLEGLKAGATIEFTLGEWTWIRRGASPAQLKPGG